jgi:chemotaxis protein MotB
MHKQSILFSIAVITLLGMLTGCVSTRKYQKIEMENQRNAETVKVLQGQLEESTALIQDMQDQLREFRRMTEEQKTLTEKELALLKQTYESLKRDFQREISSGKMEIIQVQNKMSLKVAEELFFETGKAEIKPEGRDVLRRIGLALKKIPAKNIRVEGHTDNVPIGPSLRDKYQSNWELGAARAINVVHFLQKETGIDPLRLSAVSLAQYRPVASNKTEAGRAKNRRIEIVLIDRDLDLAKKMRENL